MMKLSPIVNQFLMKHAPEALGVETREEFSTLIYQRLIDDVEFKKLALDFYIKKSKVIIGDSFDEYHSLGSDMLTTIAEIGELKAFRQYELEIFGCGNDYLMGNDAGLDILDIPATKTAYDIACLYSIGTNMLKDLDELDYATIPEHEHNLVLRTSVDKDEERIPCTTFLMDSSFHFLETSLKFISNHIKCIMPYERIVLPHDDEDVEEELLVVQNNYVNDFHNDLIMAKLTNFAITEARQIIKKEISILPDDFKIVYEAFKKDLGLFEKNIVIKDLEAFKKVSVEGFYKDIANNFSSYSKDAVEHISERINAKLMDRIDERLIELESKEKERIEMENSGISFLRKSKSIESIHIVTIEEYNEMVDDENNLHSLISTGYD